MAGKCQDDVLQRLTHDGVIWYNDVTCSKATIGLVVKKLRSEGWSIKTEPGLGYHVTASPAGWSDPPQVSLPSPPTRRKSAPKKRVLPELGSSLEVSMLIWNNGTPMIEVSQDDYHWIVTLQEVE